MPCLARSPLGGAVVKRISSACLFLLTGCISVSVNIGPGRLSQYAERTVIEEPDSQGKVAMIDIEGVISESGDEGLFGSKESVVVETIEKLKRAKEDPEVKAVLLRMDTPGGSVTASDTIHHELLLFKKEKSVPVVASFLDVSASGGYYIACASDRIVAQPTTITGSIGVIAYRVSVVDLLGKIGVKVDAVKSGPEKDMGSPFRNPTPEELAILQGLIDAMYARFLRVVVAGRKPVLDEAAVRRLADGRVFTASQALEDHLVDRIGYIRDAFGEAKSMAGLKAASLVLYSRRPGAIENEYSKSESSVPAPRAALEALAGKLLGFNLYYLWEPGLARR
jgi:protease-4